MAEATALRNNALPYPIYGAPWTVVFPMLDADGDLVTGATTPDAERSLNGDTFADCTNESTEIATASGMYYLTLTGAEMTADIVAVIAKSATAGMKTTPIVLYPRKLVSLRAGTVAANAADGTTLQLDSSASAIDDYYNGCLLIAVIDSTTEARIISDYVGSSKVCTVSPAFNTAPDNNDTFTVYLPEGRQVTQADAVGILGTAVSTPATAGILDVNVKNIDNDAASASGTVTFPNATLASTTNITAGTITTVTTTTTATNVTTVNGLAANVITATSINADAITAAKIADGAIDAATFAANAITSTVIANDAITDAKVAADVTIASVTGAVGSVTGAVGSVTGNVGGNVTGSVGSVAAGGITASSIADAAIDRATFAADTGLTTIRSNTATAGAGTTITLDASASAVDDFYNFDIVYLTGGTGAGQARFISDYVGSTKVATVPTWVTNPDNTTTFAILPFGSIPGATAPTAAEVADAVWDEDATGHQTGGSFGQAIGDPGADTTTIYQSVVTDAAGTNVAADIIAVKAETASIQSDTNDIQTRLPAALVSGRIDASVGAMASGVVTATAIAADAIGASELAADAVAEIADAVWDEAISGHLTAGTFGQVNYVIRANTAQAGAATTITLDAGASATDDLYNDAVLVITAGTGLGQSRVITDYVGSTKVATVATWNVNPSSDSVFYIIPMFPAGAAGGAPTAAENAAAVWDMDATGHQTAGTFGQAIGDPGADTNTIYSAVVTGATGATIAADIITIDDFLDTEVAAIKTKTDFLPSATAGAAGGVFIAGTNAATTITTSLTTTFTGNLTGSVGSVTGAVGSVTGNVGGNVTGSVGSVTGAVGSVTGDVGGNVNGSVASVTGLTASDVGAIKAKTDSLTYTIANVLDSNIKRVNNVVVTGTGAGGDEWGP